MSLTTVSDIDNAELIACHECDQRYRYEPVAAGERADCRCCGGQLYRAIPDSLERSLALYLAALIMFLVANCFPFLALSFGGRIEQNVLLSGGLAMIEMGQADLGVLIFLTSIAFPLFAILGNLYLLIYARLGRAAPAQGLIYRLVHAISPWSLVGVFMLGVLIAIVKLQDLATVITGPSLYALAALLIIYSAARANFDPRVLWAVSPHRPADLSKARGRILNCHTCGLLAEEQDAQQHCRRCSAPLHYRKTDSIMRTWALLFTALILIVPANVYPVMTVIRFGRGEPSTIMGGVISLIESGMFGLALIVFVASIVVPVSKLLVLGFLLISVQRGSKWRPRDRTRLYRVTEVVGAWSMVDIFLVGLLSALVSLDALSTISPGIGASFFAAVVVITMFAARSFDPRLIWDRLDKGRA